MDKSQIFALFNQWWDEGDDIANDGPWEKDTMIQFAFAGYTAAIASYKAELLKEAGEPVAFLHQWIEYHPYGDTVAGEPCSAITNDGKPFDKSDTVTPLFTSDQVAAAILKATGPLEKEIERLKTVPMKYRRMAFNAQLQDENNELRTQLAAAQEEIKASSKDSLRLLESVKYLRGIAEHGEERQQREDETVEQFVLGYVKKLEDQLAKAEQRIAELIPGNGKELSERMKRLATNSVWRYSANQNKPVDMSDPNIQELFAIIDHLCIGLNSPANGASS